MEAAGISGGWAVLAAYLLPFFFLIPLMLIRRRQLQANFTALLFIGASIGIGLACYATGFIHTTIMRTTLLFYMTPIWSTLLGVLLLNEVAGARRWLAMLIGFIGLGIMLYEPGALDRNFNYGDLAALASGLFWGIGTVLIRKSPEIDALDIVPAQFLAAALASAAFLAVEADTLTGGLVSPSIADWLTALPWLFGFNVLIVLPSLYVCALCAQVLSPGRVGILMMSEVLVAGISAPLIAGEALSLRELTAALFIMVAAGLEITTPSTGHAVTQGQ